MSAEIAQAKALFQPVRQALYDYQPQQVQSALHALFSADAVVKLAYPFETLAGAEALYAEAYAPLAQAIPDLERRDTIIMAGYDQSGELWLGACGYYTGTFVAPWLDIPPTGQQVAMRFHEFYRFQAQQVVEMQAIWDIPELMLQAKAWPLAPSLGREWQVPAPATQDGLSNAAYDADKSQASCEHVINMLSAMIRHPSQGGPELMQLEKFWHPKMNWYGPAGIGTARGMQGFRHWHQIPFLNAMPDRGQYPHEVNHHFFADGDYVAVTGWPNMRQTLSAGGWLGIAPTGQKVSLRSLDFWRLEKGLIRENWVLVDLLHLYAQIGVDVFARLREFNQARPASPQYLYRSMS